MIFLLSFYVPRDFCLSGSIQKIRGEEKILLYLLYSTISTEKKEKIHKYKQEKEKIFVYDMASNKLDATEGSYEKMFCEIRAINSADQHWTERKERFYSSSSSYKEEKKPSENYSKCTDAVIKEYYVHCTINHCTDLKKKKKILKNPEEKKIF